MDRLSIISDSIGHAEDISRKLTGVFDAQSFVCDRLSHAAPTKHVVVDIDLEDVIAAVAHDKKRVGERVPFVLVDGPGEARVGCEVAPQELRAAVGALAAASRGCG